jgi:D-aminopeptidase
MARPRLRDLGITIGRMPTGPHNAITDVGDVLVGHCTVVYDEPRIARTGVTVIFPREEPIWYNHVFAGFHVLNGNGDFTGTHWLEESGQLTTPIGLTNTHEVGVVRDALVKYSAEEHGVRQWVLPLVAETFDGWLNDINAFHLTEDHVLQAIDHANSGPVAEGNVGGGTGMICYEFKGGIGTSSRVVTTPSGQYTIGALVQANHGVRDLFRVDGVPVGREISHEVIPAARRIPAIAGSIIVIIATDAPLLSMQCRRLAQRATIGLARTGCLGHNGSGDLFLAFSTGNALPPNQKTPFNIKMLPHDQMDPLFEGTAEAVEESVLNALVAAETMTGFQGRIAYGLPTDGLQQVMQRYARR